MICPSVNKSMSISKPKLSRIAHLNMNLSEIIDITVALLKGDHSEVDSDSAKKYAINRYVVSLLLA